ncbi:MAG: ABC transporter permease [Pedosphaera sp.]|nr:ABC transporter permease [Pedosphaera sp.]MSU43083.1 ABC transporter permease [Pedosphaera sp.]
MKKNILGILGLFLAIFIFTALKNDSFLNAYNMQNLIKWSSLYAIIGLGVSFVIITGGIDLSIGSVIGLVASLLALMLSKGINPATCMALVLVLSAGIGLLHGLLITKVKLQPFVVTLCGLLFYRGLARYLTDNQSMGFQGHDALDSFFSGKVAITAKFALPAPFFFLVALAVLAAIFLNRTVWGRYLFALGNNENAARYSGINTDHLKILSYVVCSTLTGLAGVLFAFELNSVQPASTGEFYELYAIAAAVLGGCSLRGGEGSILGVIIAAAVIRLLYNSINMLGISTHLEYAIIGAVILAGVTVDELVKRFAARRRAQQQAE